jgi:drug/metabolite transporter (DMT)-like permease
VEQRVAGAGLGVALVSAGAFGTSGVFAASLLATGWSPGAAVTVRVTVAALLLTGPALLQLRGRRHLLTGGSRTLTVYGLTAVAGTQLCYFNAVQHLSVAVALLIEYSGALLVVLWLWLRRGQVPRRLTVTGAGVAVLGLGLVLEILGDAQLDAVGVLWAMGAAVGLATYFVMSAGSGGGLPPLVLAWGGLTVGAGVLLAAGGAGLLPMAASRADVVLLDADVSWLVPVLGLAVVATVLAYVTGIVAAQLLGAKVASFVGLTEVLFAVVFAWVLLGQSLSLGQLVGATLVVAGICLVRLDELRTGASVQVGSPDQDVVAQD